MIFSKYISQLRHLSAHRSYRRLLIGGTISSLGDKIGWIAFLGAVTAHNPDVLAVGGITIAEMLPAVIAAPLVSLIVDRYDRRKLMLIADVLRALLFLIAAVVPVMWVFYVAAFLSAGLTVLFEPARQAIMPNYVPEGELTQANGIYMGLMNLTLVVGPATGGLLVAAFGFKSALLINAISFVFSAWMVSDLERAPLVVKEHASTWEEVTGGFKAVRASFDLRFLFVMFAVFHIVIGIQFPLIYIFVAENLHGGAKEVGWLMSAIGVGGIIGGMLLASLSKEHNLFDAAGINGKRGVAALVIVDGLVVCFFAGLHSLPLVAVVFTLFGIIGTALHTSVTTSFTTCSEEHVRGRVFALHTALSGPLIVLSIVIGAPIARIYGAANVFYISGGLEVVIGIAGILFAHRSLKQKQLPEVLRTARGSSL